jgi:rubrerythrin
LSNPTKPTQIGNNRTGIATSPIDSTAMIAGAEELGALVPTAATNIMSFRIALSRESNPVGTMPPPASLKGVAKTIVEKLKGKNPMVYLDKLGERLAYERTGVRLYDAFLAKFEASDSRDGSVTSQAIIDIRDDELVHVGVLHQAIQDLGGDPTAMTPCADVTAMASLGLLQAITAPATTFTQALSVVLIAELADNVAWELLSDLADGLGQDEHVRLFNLAIADEQRHLEMVSRWHATAVVHQAGVADEVLSSSPEMPT